MPSETMLRSLVTFAITVSMGCLQQSMAFVLPSTIRTTSSRKAASADAISSLPPLSDTESDGLVSGDALRDRLAGKRVALYFSAGWCPMCTSFEPALNSFREAASDSGKPVELVYVPSDRSDDDALKRAAALGMMTLTKDQAADCKKRFNIWAGSESLAFGFGRRSGVPALVVLDDQTGDEMAFLPAEARGTSALGDWPLDEGVW
mmetsp:Transcript_24646/g.68049  ORF Transcript_24646/g.68049 Transcript_24646/m.68049 type:complete len:205 (+) Transcript_24646:242-856(+)